jgi:hypothetical protein
MRLRQTEQGVTDAHRNRLTALMNAVPDNATVDAPEFVRALEYAGELPGWMPGHTALVRFRARYEMGAALRMLAGLAGLR